MTPKPMKCFTESFIRESQRIPTILSFDEEFP
jgi:hypothetical protein